MSSPIGYSVIVTLTGLPIGYSVIVALTGLPIGYSVIVALTGLPIGYSVIVALTGLPIGYSVIVALTGLPIGYSVIVALTGLPIGYSVIVALTGLPIGYSVIVALTGLPIGYSIIVALTGLLIGYSVIVALTGLSFALHRCEECIVAEVPHIKEYKKNWSRVEKAVRVAVSLVRDDGVVYRTGLNYTFSPEPPPMSISESITYPDGRDSSQAQAMGNMNGYDKPTDNDYTRNHVKKTERHRPPPLLVLPNQNGAVVQNYTPAVCSIEQLTPNSPLLTDSSTTSPPPKILSPPKIQEHHQPMLSHVKPPSSITTCWNGSFPGVSMSHTYPGDCRILQTMHVPPQLVPIKQQEEQALLLQQNHMATGQICMPPQLVPIPQQGPYQHPHGNAMAGVIPTVSLATLQQAVFPQAST